jgi:hypothetical protein
MESIKILLVEDDVALRASLKRDLERPGYQVLTAEHGNAALIVHNNEHIDVIMTDIMMPEKGVALSSSTRSNLLSLKNSRLHSSCPGYQLRCPDYWATPVRNFAQGTPIRDQTHCPRCCVLRPEPPSRHLMLMVPTTGFSPEMGKLIAGKSRYEK